MSAARVIELPADLLASPHPLPEDAATTLREAVARLKARQTALAPDAGTMALARQAEAMATIAFELHVRREELAAAYLTASKLVPYSTGATMRVRTCARMVALLGPVGTWRGFRPAHELWTLVAAQLEERVRQRLPIGETGDVAYLQILAQVYRREALRLAT